MVDMRPSAPDVEVGGGEGTRNTFMDWRIIVVLNTDNTRIYMYTPKYVNIHNYTNTLKYKPL